VSTLSQSDVARLLAQPSAQARAEVAGKLAQDIDNPELSESEVRMAQDIIRILATDIEAVVRQTVSQSLRYSGRLPHDVAVRLACDIEGVALPVLTDSGVLTAADLVAIVRLGSARKQTAIAGRRDLAEDVADALITHADVTAVAALMRNATAHISERGFGKAIDRFPDDDTVKESIARRETLPITIAERLVALVADHVKNYLVSHHELSPAVATDIVLQTRDVTTINLSRGCRGEDLERLVAEMHRHGRLTPFLVLRALCLGDIEFFEAAMAALAHVPVANAQRLIHDAGPNGLRSLFEKSGLPARLFPAIRVAVHVVEGVKLDGAEHDLERYRARVITRILTQFERFCEEDLDYLLDKLIAVLAVTSGHREYAEPAGASA
jgi:uncharacterized protein (DUF2336 family)